MKTRTILILFVVLAVAGTLHSCSSDRTTAPGPGIQPAAYLDTHRPENVIENLQRAYRNRDIAAFEELLAPEFVFRFQPQDARRTGQKSWGYDEEVRSTRNMFQSEKVKEIEIRLTTQEAVPATEPGLEHTMLVRVSSTFLRIRETDGTVHQVSGDRQDFFLRRGRGNYPNRWYIVEWRDLPGAR